VGPWSTGSFTLLGCRDGYVESSNPAECVYAGRGLHLFTFQLNVSTCLMCWGALLVSETKGSS